MRTLLFGLIVATALSMFLPAAIQAAGDIGPGENGSVFMLAGDIGPGENG